MVRLFVRTRTHPQLQGVTSLQHITPTGVFCHPDLSGQYFMPGWGSYGTEGGNAPVADRIYFWPIYLTEAMTIAAVSVRVNTTDSGKIVRLGLYDADRAGANLYMPSALQQDFGTISTSSSGDKDISTTPTITAGYHFLAWSADTTVARLGAMKYGDFAYGPVGQHIAVMSAGSATISRAADSAGSSAELPDPAPSTNVNIGFPHGAVWLKG